MAKKKLSKEKTTEGKEPENQEVEEESSPDENQEKKKQFDFSEPGQLVAAFQDDTTEEELKGFISDHIDKLLVESGLTGYQVALLYDTDKSINTYPVSYTHLTMPTILLV